MDTFPIGGLVDIDIAIVVIIASSAEVASHLNPSANHLDIQFVPCSFSSSAEADYMSIG